MLKSELIRNTEREIQRGALYEELDQLSRAAWTELKMTGEAHLTEIVVALRARMAQAHKVYRTR